MKKKLSIAAICLLTVLSVQGQCDCNVGRMIHKIDSISHADSIFTGQVIFNKSTDDLGEMTGSFKSEFKFDGDFLILGGVYYNMSKLLYFTIKKKYIEFVFQKI